MPFQVVFPRSRGRVGGLFRGRRRRLVALWPCGLVFLCSCGLVVLVVASWHGWLFSLLL